MVFRATVVGHRKRRYGGIVGDLRRECNNCRSKGKHTSGARNS